MTIEYTQAINEHYKRLGYEPYRWLMAEDPPPWQPLTKTPAAVRLGLLSTSGAYALGQVAYHYKDDTSIRQIPAATADTDLRFSHVAARYLADGKRDPACIFPLRTLCTLEAEGFIGQLADKVFSCMGGVYSPRRVREEVAPALLAAFKAQQVDAALLVAM